MTIVNWYLVAATFRHLIWWEVPPAVLCAKYRINSSIKKEGLDKRDFARFELKTGSPLDGTSKLDHIKSHRALLSWNCTEHWKMPCHCAMNSLQLFAKWQCWTSSQKPWCKFPTTHTPFSNTSGRGGICSCHLPQQNCPLLETKQNTTANYHDNLVKYQLRLWSTGKSLLSEMSMCISWIISLNWCSASFHLVLWTSGTP